MAVTFLFSDIERSTDLVRQVGDGVFAEIRADHRRLLREVFQAHGGREVDTAGDGFFVAFDGARDQVLAAFPNASDAIRAAAAVRDALGGANWPPVRITIHSGRWSGDPLRPAASTALSRLMRLAKAAKPGQVLVSQTSAALVDGDRSLPELSDLGELRIPELDQPVYLYELT